jgi:hypothetical protein
VALEDDAEHVVDLALERFGAGMQLEERRYGGVIGGNLDPDADAAGLEVVDQPTTISKRSGSTPGQVGGRDG